MHTSMKTKLKGIHLFIVLVVFAVIATIGIGLALVGSPQETRSHGLDDQRVSNLQQIMYAINSYSLDTAKLPDSLTSLAEEPNTSYLSSLKDPETQQLYEYLPTSSSTYQLCATFSAPTSPESNVGIYSQPYPVKGDESTLPNFWQHDAGRKCYGLKVTFTQPTSVPPTAHSIPATPPPPVVQ